MNDSDHDLDLRLAALAARAPALGDPPALERRGRRGRIAVSLALAPALTLALVATVTAGAVVVANMARGYPGIQNPGQPLEGARMECMSPPQAAAFLAAHGYTDVVWQVESGVGSQKVTTTVTQAIPPEHGYVVPGSVLDDGRLHMVVDQRTDATGVGACYGAPMP